MKHHLFFSGKHSVDVHAAEKLGYLNMIKIQIQSKLHNVTPLSTGQLLQSSFKKHSQIQSVKVPQITGQTEQPWAPWIRDTEILKIESRELFL